MAETELPVLDGHVRRFLEDLATHATRPVYELTPEEARDSLRTLQGEPPPVDDIAVATHFLQVEGQRCPLHIVRRVRSEQSGVTLYLHGAGWVMGDFTTHGHMVRELARSSGVAVAFLEYGRAPEHPYPTALNQAYAAAQYLMNQASDLGLDGSKLAIAGDSAGGSLAAAVALLIRQRGDTPIACQLLFYPVTSAEMDTASYHQFGSGPWLTKKAMEWFWDQYVPDAARRVEPTAAPLGAPLVDLEGLPPNLIVTAEYDPLRDEGEAYGRRLLAAGVEVTAIRCNGTIHDFLLLNALSQSAPTRAAYELAAWFLKKHC
jgi:acetyl esterase